MSKSALPLVALVIAALVLAACDRDPVIWNDDAAHQALIPPAAVAVSPDAVVDSIRDATLHAVIPAATRPSVSPPSALSNGAGPACLGTMRVAAGKGDERDAVWWAARANGSAVLLASRSADAGRSWAAPVRVDTLDVGGTACQRPAPSIVVDTTNDYVHVAYSIAAPDGVGVFYAHRMGPTVPFELPQVIVYGDHLTRTSVAADDNTVVVAYEDPNAGGRPYISLALSRTAGHSWAERFAVSSESEAAERPAVAVRGGTIAVAWLVPNLTRPSEGNEAPAPTSGGVVVVRAGRLR